MGLERHLGGHFNFSHIDEGALKWSIEKYNVKTFLDIGCGPGAMVQLAEQYGLQATGIDGDYTLKRYNEERFIIHDYTKGVSPFRSIVDLCWSVEFVEHVEEKYIPHFLPDFAKAKHIIITYAPPGWPGHHHVNCKPQEYWVEQFSKYGLEFSEKDTDELRRISTMNIDKPSPKQFVKNRGMVFHNKNLKDS